MPNRDTLYRLVDRLPESEIDRAQRVLAALLESAEEEDDPVLRSLREAPVDDEPETPEERAAVEEALREIREGRTIPHEEVKRRWGG